ncbi:hypothetical protein AG1IA_03580 [Rhizoctonia solani AG-1 IA]|uniref:Uncharacterized protein n=1 Tax=Thanatephorus cucumeris (strain AG1-IA) TaxID=983506 RepID=L8WWE7_THACA|nr:hypothetical protein AG1IA_03580 [Rhizoctonia solani AG-1 IA]
MPQFYPPLSESRVKLGKQTNADPGQRCKPGLEPERGETWIGRLGTLHLNDVVERGRAMLPRLRVGGIGRANIIGSYPHGRVIRHRFEQQRCRLLILACLRVSLHHSVGEFQGDRCLIRCPNVVAPHRGSKKNLGVKKIGAHVTWDWFGACSGNKISPIGTVHFKLHSVFLAE